MSNNIPQGWRDDGTTLYCPNDVPGGPDIPIVGVIRDYLLNLPQAWPYGNVALCAEYETPQLAENDEALGGGKQQPFRYAILNVPASGAQAGQVLFGWGIRTLMYVRAQLAQARVDLATAQAAALAIAKKKQSGIPVDAVLARMSAIEALTKQPF